MAGQKSMRLSTMNRYVNLYMAATTRPGIMHSIVPQRTKSPISREATRVGTKSENIHQRHQYQKKREAHVVALHHGVAGLHGRPKIHALVHDEQIRELVHGGHYQARDNA